MSQPYVLLTKLAMDKSHARKYILRKGFTFLQVRTAETGNQLALALTADDAAAVRHLRPQTGFAAPAPNLTSWFYIVQIFPDLDPRRVKLGMATDPHRRLQEYVTLAPMAQLLKSWPARPSWEGAAIDSATRHCRRLGVEVFVVDDIPKVIERLDAFFALMPDPLARVPIER